MKTSTHENLNEGEMKQNKKHKKIKILAQFPAIQGERTHNNSFSL